jgi:hypothetical protein
MPIDHDPGRVPNFWVRIQMSPPKQRRDEVREIVKRWGGKLREDQLYKQIGRPGIGYVLIKGPDDPAAYNHMLDDLDAGPGTIHLLDIDEAQVSFDLTPPPPDSEA